MEIDGTLLFQVAGLLLALSVLSRLLLSPVLNLLAERERLTTGVQQEAQQLLVLRRQDRADPRQHLGNLSTNRPQRVQCHGRAQRQLHRVDAASE